MFNANAVTITIVTVSFNDLNRLKSTALSLQSQQDQDFEWLIVDGNSTDGTQEFIKTLKLDCETNLICAPPRGIYNAMNLGIKSAQHMYVWFINAGDVLLSSDSIQTVKSEILSFGIHKQAYAFPVAHISRSGIMPDISVPSILEFKDYMIANVNHQGAVISKEALESVGGFDESLKLAADGKLLDIILSKYGFVFSNHVFVGFEMGGTAARRFEETIRETRSYRPSIKERSRYILIRNYFRILLLNTENVRFLGIFAKKYFARKAKLTLNKHAKDLLIHS